jgi:Family of unknown function (DUF6325)
MPPARRLSTVEVTPASGRRCDKKATMDVGPVELIVLMFPGERPDPEVASALADVVVQGDVTVLDLVYLTHTTDGQVRVTDVAENLDDAGFGSLEVTPQALVSEDDLDLVRDELKPGSSAAVIVYEHTWARHLAAAVEEGGGQVGLHVQIPRETVETALAGAAGT